MLTRPEGLAVVDTERLLALPRRWLAALDRALSGRRWIVWVVLGATAISLFLAFPAYGRFEPKGEDWLAILRNADHPFDQTGLTPTSRAYNFTFRVTVPLIGGRLGLTPAGYLVLQGLAGAWLFSSVARIVHRLTASRRLAALTTVAVGMTWAGAMAFVEVRGNFDSVAVALVLAAMATRRWWLALPFAFLAAWTDERAIFALAFAVAFHAVVECGADLRIRRLIREPLCLAVAGGTVLHVISRLVAQRAFDVEQPSNFGLSYFEQYINLLPAGTWTGLEGLWVFVALGLVILLVRRELLVAAAYLAAIAVLVVVSMSVTDITRSMAYLLPAAFVGLAVSARWCTPALNRYATYAAFALCAAWPVYYAGGENTVYWIYPAVLQIVRGSTGAY